MMIDYILIGEQIRTLRKSGKITQAELAEMTDLSVPYISHIETGRKKASLETFVKIANALKVSANRLLHGNLLYDLKNSIDELDDLLSDCSYNEKYVIYCAAKAIKNGMRKID